MHAQYPRMADTIRSSKALRTTSQSDLPQYWQDYHWFHSSLMVWFRWHGHSFPSLKYLWRIEPDVLLTGELGTLVRWSASHSADLVLPSVAAQYQKGWVGLFQRDMSLFEGIPPERRVFSLVCFGRYSLRFLKHMDTVWAAGRIGFEEVFLPTTCLNASHGASGGFDCSLHSVGQGLPDSTGSIVLRASSVRYRPEHRCEDFLAVLHRRRKRSSLIEFWHPVKDRECLLAYLDRNRSAIATAEVAIAPPPSPPPPPLPPRLPPEDERRAVSRMPFVFKRPELGAIGRHSRVRAYSSSYSTRAPGGHTRGKPVTRHSAP